MGLIFSPVTAAAWTGPTGSAPNNNVSAPLNVGTATQDKSGTIGVNGLAVFGNTLLGGAVGSNSYLNFGTTAGTSGYGLWDNSGTLEFKNSGGSWASLQSIIYNYTQGSGQWATNGSTIYYNSGNVGIGTSNPGDKLDVNGSVRSVSSPQYGVLLQSWGLLSNEGSSNNNIYLEPNQNQSVVIEDNAWTNTAHLCLNGSCITSWPSSVSLPYPVTSSQTWNWSGQSGQPSWLWGSNDGNNFYVWNPSNFSVNYANSAGSANSANSVDGYTFNQWVTSGANPTFGNIYLNYGPGWISNWLNQNVSNGANPTFGTIYTTSGAVYQNDGNIYMAWADEYLSQALANSTSASHLLGGQFWTGYGAEEDCPSGALEVGVSLSNSCGSGPSPSSCADAVAVLCQWIN